MVYTRKDLLTATTEYVKGTIGVSRDDAEEYAVNLLDDILKLIE